MLSLVSVSPRRFTGIRSLLLEYSANAKAWMTGDLFSQWLGNKKLASKNRHVLLVIDNCPAHPHYLNLSNIKLHALASQHNSQVTAMWSRRHLPEGKCWSCNDESNSRRWCYLFPGNFEPLHGIKNSYIFCMFSSPPVSIARKTFFSSWWQWYTFRNWIILISIVFWMI